MTLLWWLLTDATGPPPPSSGYPEPPQTNAIVTSVVDDSAATGGRDDWDQPGAEPPGGAAAKWAGNVRGYFTTDLERVQTAGGVDLEALRTLIVTSTWVRAVNLDEGDTLTITPDDGDTVTARANLIAIRELDGIPPGLQTTRITLEIT